MAFSAVLALTARSNGCSAEYCSGQPRSCPPAATALFRSARPESSKAVQKQQLTFLNAATESAVVSWLSGNGSVGSIVATIRPGESHRVDAQTGDAFTAITEAGQLLLEYFVGPAVVRRCDCPDAHLVVCPPRQPSKHNASQRPLYEPAGFLNYADSPVDVYMYTERCEHLLTVSSPIAASGGQAHYAAWAGQRFRVRRHSDARLLMEHTVGQVLVRPCRTASSGRELATLQRQANEFDYCPYPYPSS